MEAVAGREADHTLAGVAPGMVERVLPVQLLELCLVYSEELLRSLF